MLTTLSTQFSPVAILISLFGAAGVYLVLKLAGRAFLYAFDEPVQTRQLRRIYPAIEAIIWLLYMVWSARLILRDPLLYEVAVLSILFGSGIFLGWYAGRDWIAGLILKMREPYDIDQRIRIDEIEGKILRMGFLVIELEKDDGEIVKLPYHLITSSIHYKIPSQQGELRHRFEIEMASADTAAAAGSLLRQAILTSPWSSFGHEPRVRLLDEKDAHYRFEVIAYCTDESLSNELEESVRKSVGNSAWQGRELS